MDPNPMNDTVITGPCRSAAIAGVLLAAILVFGPAGCGGDRQEGAEKNRGGAKSESFTFFDLGADSVFSDRIRDNLKKKLGNDAIGYRNMIDLGMNTPGFLETHFPDLDAINRRLNSAVGERVDHDSIKLMYRYARTVGTPFDYVEIIFSGYDKHPLLLRIRFREDSAGTIDSLSRKYGPPLEIDWGDRGGRTLYWRKQQDYLMVSLVPDQFGKPDYHVAIIFTANLKQLIDKEEAERQNRPAESDRSAF